MFMVFGLESLSKSGRKHIILILLRCISSGVYLCFFPLGFFTLYHNFNLKHIKLLNNITVNSYLVVSLH